MYRYIKIHIAVQHERGPRNSVILQTQNRIVNNQDQCRTQFLESFTKTMLLAEPDLAISPESKRRPLEKYTKDSDVLTEMVARLLFKCVGWLKNIASYLKICFNDQVSKE